MSNTETLTPDALAYFRSLPLAAAQRLVRVALKLAGCPGAPMEARLQELIALEMRR